MHAELVIRSERPDQPEVLALLDALDTYLAGLYAPEDNHILGVQQLLAEDVLFLVARRGGAAVGCGAARRMPAEPDTGGMAYGEIKRMFVAPAQRGQRIAEAMLAQLEAGLRSDGIPQALLETGGDQAEALRLYRRAGYAVRGPFGGYPDNGLSVFMAKAL
ncbi:GNAT family N-acetyltransferase [Pseudaquabacterium pictum]|uniref:N-acetyltransferase n=1 Tax=Pseudaquabacterium pictum TaxID=2315236 RepID=A0A480ANX4_9BURK|nr:GNAT family N-acetyltransferase [Rubrivivax pictus]GCL61365.1 N-acetyltransferase [Rubrivivax pictus]